MIQTDDIEYTYIAPVYTPEQTGYDASMLLNRCTGDVYTLIE